MFASVAQANGLLTIQSTTSTQNSGLYEAILPVFTEETGIDVRVIAVGTGQAIKNATNCDGDILLVHAKSSEEEFVSEGFGTKRYDVMYNDFVIVGPSDDPSKLGQADTISAVFETVVDSQTIFISRGDNSGTHKKELTLWQEVGFDPSESSGKWYRETGAGMGTTLNITVGMNAYTMTDRATWLAFQNKRDHRVIFEGDEAMFNQYGIVNVNPSHCPNVKAELANHFTQWILSDGQAEIAKYTRNGEQLFFPNAAEQPLN